MQLFLTPYQQEKNLLIIREERVISQCIKVLRYTTWSEFLVQSTAWRKKVKLQRSEKNALHCNILESFEIPKPWPSLSMAIALPNKIDKVELIIQKLTEIWVDQIIFRPSARSQMREITHKKIARLESIITEAVEQSGGRYVPKLIIAPDLQTYTKDSRVIIFDIWECHQIWDLSLHDWTQATLWVVGPEWWLDVRDYQDFWKLYTRESLGVNILRMETAAIVAAWKLKNLSLL